MKRYRKKFMDSDTPLWLATGWVIIVAAALCTLLCLANIPHMPIWR